MGEVSTTRRGFLGGAFAAAAAAVSLSGGKAVAAPAREYGISLAAWSLHRAFFANLLKQIDLPAVARRTFGIEAIELVNSFFPSPQARYLTDLNRRATDEGVKILLIMVDGEGALGHSDPDERGRAVQNHFKWVDIASRLGCHSIRVNMRFDDEQQGQASINASQLGRATESFSRLVEYSSDAGISVIIENHGGLSSDANALVQVMKAVDSPHFGTLPDFGNFPPEADKYESVRKLMPYAKAVSAKCHDFDEKGDETRIDYQRMLGIVVDEAGYDGFIGIEYEGERLTEWEGISRCKGLLERLKT